MNKKIKVFILFFSFAIFVGVVSFNFYYENELAFGHNVISSEDADKIRQTRQYNDEKVELHFNSIKIPFIDGYDDYLLPQLLENEYNGILTCGNYDLAIIDEGVNKLDLMKTNTPLQVLIYDQHTYKTVYLTMTNLPIVELYDNGEINGENIGASFRLIDIDSQGRNILSEISSQSFYHIRGGTSVLFPKKSYKLNLKIKNLKTNDKNLLGMRDDDDWILNAMHIDDSKIREQVAYDLLNMFYENDTDNLKYCELIVNEEYRGLYGLQIPFDYKYFSLSKNEDYIVKVKLYQSNFNERTLFDDRIIDLRKQYVDEFNISQSDSINYDLAIDLLRALIADVDNLGTNSNLRYDIDSLAKYNVYINLIGAADNSSKNEIILFSKMNDSYVVRKYPWDLDYSMAEDFFGSTSADSIYQDSYLSSEIMQSDEYMQKQKEYYTEARNSFFNINCINKIIDFHSYELTSGGGVSREREKWSQQSNNIDEIQLIKEFFVTRIKILDEFYGYEG